MDTIMTITYTAPERQQDRTTWARIVKKGKRYAAFAARALPEFQTTGGFFTPFRRHR